MTEKERLYKNDEKFEQDFEELYRLVSEKYNTKELRKYIHYKSIYNLYLGLRHPKIKRKSLKFRVLMIEYLNTILIDDTIINGTQWEKSMKSKELFEKDFAYHIGKFLGAYQNYEGVSYLKVNYVVLIFIISGIGFYFLDYYGILLGILPSVLCYFHYQKKKKQNKLYGFQY